MNIAIIGSTQEYENVDYGMYEYENAILSIQPLIERAIRGLDKKTSPIFIFCGSPLSDCMTLDIATRLYEEPKIQYHLPCDSITTLKNSTVTSSNDVVPLVLPGEKLMKEYNKLPDEEKSYFLSLYDKYGFSETTVYNGHTARNDAVASLTNLLICVTTMSHNDFFDPLMHPNSGTKYVFSKCKSAKYHYSLIDKTIESQNYSPVKNSTCSIM